MTNSTRPHRAKKHAVRRRHRVAAGRRLAVAALAVALLVPAPLSSQAASGDWVLPHVYGGAALSFLNSAVSALGAFFGGLPGGVERAGVGRADLAALRRPLTKAEREAKVARLELNTDRELKLTPGGRMLFAAVPVDGSGATVHGLTARWATSDERVLRIDEDGQAVVVQPGEVRLTARAGSRQETVSVTVAEAAPQAPGTQGLPGPRDAPDARAPIRPAARRRWRTRPGHLESQLVGRRVAESGTRAAPRRAFR